MNSDEAESIMRESWNLGWQLSGSPEGATAALVRVLAAHDDIRKLAQDRRHRLTVMGAREWLARDSTAPRAGTVPCIGAVDRVRALDPQPREAWVMLELNRWGEIEASRAMGVARSAVASYHRSAHSDLQKALGSGYDGAVESIRAGGPASEVDAGIDAAMRTARRFTRRRRIFAALKLALLLLVLGTLGWIGLDLQHASERERANQALGDSVSNPIPKGLSK